MNPALLEDLRQYDVQFSNNRGFNIFCFTPIRPLSRGTIRLASSNPMDSPLIDPAYYSNLQDLVTKIRAMSIGVQMLETPQLAVHFQSARLPVPGCGQYFCASPQPISQVRIK